MFKINHKSDNFITGSFFLFLATMMLNIIGYFFHVFMGRFLGPESYGILGTLLSVLALISIPSMVIQLSLSKFVSEFKAQRTEEKINTLLRRSYKRLVAFGFLATLALIILSPTISYFLKIPLITVVVLSPALFLTFLIPINRSVFQGLQKFNLLGVNLISEGLTKLLLGIALVWIGFRVNGAIFAIVISFLLPTIIGALSLKKFLKKHNSDLNTKNIYKYSLPVLTTLVLLTLIYNVDIFIVKYFFSGIEAGYYIAASLLGKIILFVSTSIATVLFPKSVESITLNISTKGLLKKALMLTSIPSILITIGYFILPNFAISLLFGEAFYPMASILGLFGIAMSLFSFVYLLSFYNLSINKTKFVYFLFGSVVLEIALIFLFHSSLEQVLFILNIVLIILLSILTLYTKLNR